jgi:hypothetical protein
VMVRQSTALPASVEVSVERCTKGERWGCSSRPCVCVSGCEYLFLVNCHVRVVFLSVAV